MEKVILLGILAGLCFGVTPLLGRFSSMKAMPLAVMIAFGSVVSMLSIAFKQNYMAAGVKGIVFAALTGLLNGGGLFFLYSIVSGAGERDWDMAGAIATCFVVATLTTALGSILLFHEAVTAKRVIGIILACVVIWFLK